MTAAECFAVVKYHRAFEDENSGRFKAVELMNANTNAPVDPGLSFMYLSQFISGCNMKMRNLLIFLVLLVLPGGETLHALGPERILIVANKDIKASMEIARYYCSKRNVPRENIIAVSLGPDLQNEISRDDYDKLLVGSVRERLRSPEFIGETVCLLTVYGVPFRVAGRGMLNGQGGKLRELRKFKEQVGKSLAELGTSEAVATEGRKEVLRRQLAYFNSGIDSIEGKETHASVDSELSMALYGKYELYRWQPNRLKGIERFGDFETVMVCRLDGPGEDIVKGLIDKAMAAEKTGLKGKVYIDTGYSAQRNNSAMFVEYDKSMGDAGGILKSRAGMDVIVERTTNVFEPGTCPETAVYCGWYSLAKYVDAFEFVPGAIGYHIASLEAVDIRDSQSGQWCPAMLADGVTVTIGAVAEPYLSAFPDPKEFFDKLLDGKHLVEAYYLANPYNSWQMILIGDPLYRPFKNL